MRLYEYEAKELLAKAGISIPEGEVVTDPDQAHETAARLDCPVIVKAQVLAGGRGKVNAVVAADSPHQAALETERLLKSQVKGWRVSKVLIEEKLAINQEYYLSCTIDPYGTAPLLIASSSGGVNVEETAVLDPDQFHFEYIDVFRGPGIYQARNLLSKSGLQGKQLLKASDILIKLYGFFREQYAQLAEVNPLALTDDGRLVALDAKISLDHNAQKLLDQDMISRNRFQNDLEYEAARHGLSYVKLDGEIGVACTGAGLTLSTLDMINKLGGKPANFLEFGGATYGNAFYALKTILNDPDVRVVLINTFGLVARADVIAEGLVKAIKDLKPTIPIVAAVRGTGEDKAREILKKEVNIDSLLTTQAVVQQAVEITRGGE